MEGYARGRGEGREEGRSEMLAASVRAVLAGRGIEAALDSAEDRALLGALPLWKETRRVLRDWLAIRPDPVVRAAAPELAGHGPALNLARGSWRVGAHPLALLSARAAGSPGSMRELRAVSGPCFT